jgi:5'-methylthioadenosine phosphorylase
LYDLGERDDAQHIEVSSPFGRPSSAITLVTIAGVRFAFLPRHGPGHRLSPEAVPYRANIDALKRCGVTDILAVSAIGSLREELAPGSFVAVDQFIDRTSGRDNSFFGAGLGAHVSMADPTCPRLTALAVAAARSAGAAVHEGGCYLAMQGPQFSTRAESRLYRQWGADVIGMTAMPEARLAREAELPYALLGMVTDYDAWREGEAVDVAQVLGVVAANAALARNTLSALARLLPPRREPSPIDTALDRAIVTATSARDPALAARLDAVAGRVLR